MAADRKRLTLDVDASLQRRLKAVAARRGVSMREYCETAIDRELTRDEMPAPRFTLAVMDRLMEVRATAPDGGMFEDDSVDLIREAREERTPA